MFIINQKKIRTLRGHQKWGGISKNGDREGGLSEKGDVICEHKYEGLKENIKIYISKDVYQNKSHSKGSSQKAKMV